MNDEIRMTPLKFGDDDVMVADEVAARLRVAVNTLAGYEKGPNPLPVHRLGSGPKAPKRYIRSEVDAWLRSRCSDQAPGLAS